LAYFDHFAAGKGTRIGNWLTARAIERQFEFLSRHLPGASDSDLLEIGPGHGDFAARIMAAGFRNYDVVEPNPALRAKVEALGVRRARSYLIPELDEADESYDAIILCDVFEHLTDSREAHKFVSEAVRVLRPGGILFILSPDFLDWKEDFYNCDYSHSNPTTVRRAHEIFMNERLTTAGFQYMYSGFRGAFGYCASRLVKLGTSFARSEDLDRKPYKLRLTFLRRFMIVGRKDAA
jgi:SAM-dependent methyltransferase